LPVAGVPLDGRVLAFTPLLSALTSLLFGMLPALATRRVDRRSSMASRSVASTERLRLRQALIAGEVALTVLLLAGSDLLIRSLVHLETLPPGFNQAFAKKYFPGQDPLQKQIDLGGKDTGMIKPYSIVGVLADQVDSNVGGVVRPLILLSQHQVPTTSLFYQALLKTVVSFVVRSRGEIPIAAEMRSLFHQVAPGFALEDFETMEDLVQKNTFSQRLGLYLVGSFAGLAVAMVVAGLYGVLSQLVSYRRREIGIRMALGATGRSVAQLILRQGSIVIGSGLGIGLLLAFATGRWKFRDRKL
jgi:hypothetical protein